MGSNKGVDSEGTGSSARPPVEKLLRAQYEELISIGNSVSTIKMILIFFMILAVIAFVLSVFAIAPQA